MQHFILGYAKELPHIFVARELIDLFVQTVI